MAKKATFEIFKAGKHSPMSGGTLSFSEADLQASVKAYNPALHEAPLTIGHPKDNLPAYGWVQALAFSEEGGLMLADADQVNADFAEMVNNGAFKKRSASFYAPDSPNNPVPGTYYLRHVAFLGAQPPAVKGLRDVAFADGEDGVVEIQFGEPDSWDFRQIARGFRGLRDWIAGKFDLATADEAIPSHLVESLEQSANRQDPEPTKGALTPAFSEPKEATMTKTPAELAAEQEAREKAAAEEKARLEALEKREAELKVREEAVAKTEADAKAAEEAATKAEHTSFAEGLAKEGRLAPSDKGAVVELLTLAAKGAPLEFGEGDKKTTTAPADVLKRLLSERPKLVEFGELGIKGVDGKPLDPQEMAKRVVEFQEKEAAAGRTVSVTQAYEAVTKEQR